MAHIHQPLPLPTSIDPDIGPRLEATLLKALAKDPNDWFRSGRDLIQALSIAAGIAGESAPRPEGADTEVIGTGAALPPDAHDAPTAILGATADAVPAGPSEAAGQRPGTAARAQPMSGEPEVAAPEVRRQPPLLLIGGGVVVVFAAIAAFLALSGGESSTDVAGTPAATAPAGQPTPAPRAHTASGPYHRVRTCHEPRRGRGRPEGLTTRAEENVLRLRDLSIDDFAIEPQFRTRQQLESITKGILRRDSTRQLLFEAEELYKVL